LGNLSLTGVKYVVKEDKSISGENETMLVDLQQRVVALTKQKPGGIEMAISTQRGGRPSSRTG